MLKAKGSSGVSLRRSCHRIEHVKDRLGSELYGVASEAGSAAVRDSEVYM